MKFTDILGKTPIRRAGITHAGRGNSVQQPITHPDQALCQPAGIYCQYSPDRPSRISPHRATQIAVSPHHHTRPALPAWRYSHQCPRKYPPADHQTRGLRCRTPKKPPHGCDRMPEPENPLAHSEAHNSSVCPAWPELRQNHPPHSNRYSRNTRDYQQKIFPEWC